MGMHVLANFVASMVVVAQLFGWKMIAVLSRTDLGLELFSTKKIFILL